MQILDAALLLINYAYHSSTILKRFNKENQWIIFFLHLHEFPSQTVLKLYVLYMLVMYKILYSLYPMYSLYHICITSRNTLPRVVKVLGCFLFCVSKLN